MTLASLLDDPSVNAARVTRHISDLSAHDYSAECLGLDPARQRMLWLLASSADTPVAGELLPGPVSKFAGRNSLPLLSRFEKWFAQDGGAIVGCNRHPLNALIGPGYFVVDGQSGHSLEFDYGRAPDRAPPGWPPVRSNTTAMSRPVYGNLLDRVFWISPNVLVGAAFRGGVSLDSYFVLVRRAI